MTCTVTAYDFGELRLDFLALRACWRGRVYPLTHGELVFLFHVARAGRPVPTDALAVRLFGENGAGERMRVHEAAHRVRRQIPGLVVTARRGGRYGLFSLAPDDAAQEVA